jgi:hypothetical protein
MTVSSYDPSIHKFVGNDSVLKDVPYQYFYDSEIEKEVEYKKDFDFFSMESNTRDPPPCNSMNYYRNISMT